MRTEGVYHLLLNGLDRLVMAYISLYRNWYGSSRHSYSHQHPFHPFPYLFLIPFRLGQLSPATSGPRSDEVLGPRPLFHLLRTPRRILPIRRNPPLSPKISTSKSPATGTHTGHSIRQILSIDDPRKVRARGTEDRRCSCEN